MVRMIFTSHQGTYVYSSEEKTKKVMNLLQQSILVPILILYHIEIFGTPPHFFFLSRQCKRRHAFTISSPHCLGPNWTTTP